MPTDYAIKDGRTVFDATTYTGNGSTQSITNAGKFKPDLIWFKRRDAAAGHALNDSVRGVTKSLSSSSAGAEETSSAGTDLTSFNSNGFSVGATNIWSSYNVTGGSLVAWQWQAGQGTNVTNTSGSTSSTVSANPTAGFSIVTWTGNGSVATIGHGLGVAPAVVLVKNRTTAGVYWTMYHQALGNTTRVTLNTTDAKSGDWIEFWNNTSPTSSVFTVGTNTNNSGGALVAYCWAEVAGFSKFGSYTGNGSADGPFVYTGFRPKFIMIKRTDAVDYWYMLDTSRNTYNLATSYLDANASVAEGTANFFDILSNGFKIRDSGTYENASGGTYVYMAFAENPFKYSLAR